MSTQTIEATEIDPVTGKGRVTHIVKQSDDKTAQAVVMEAMIEGTEVEALCGHRWVPSRDPQKYPVCEPCVEVYHSKVDPNDGMPDP